MGQVELGITLKGDGGAPWVTLKGTVDEQSQALSELRKRNAWDAISAAAKDFQESWRMANAVGVVRAAMPGSEVVSQELPASQQVVCSQCGGVATHKKGVSERGTPYDGFYCAQWHKVK